MIKSRIRIVAALAALLVTHQATALGLGKARIDSDMSAPLRLSIPIAGFAASGIDVESLRVNVPGFVDQATLGVPDPVMPEGVRTIVFADGRGGAVVRISTRNAVREPVLRFALRASWPGGEVVKTYELIIDPPYVAYPGTSASPTITVRPSTAPAARQAASFARTATAPVSASAGSRFGPIAEGATLYPIARSAYPQLTTRLPQVMEILVERNRDAFVGGDANRLLRGAVLELPALNDMQRSLAAASQLTTRETAGNTSYTVAEGDTLYAIARRELGVAEGELPATVAQIHALNPQAFASGDINRLQVGAIVQLGASANRTLADVTNATATSAPAASVAPARATRAQLPATQTPATTSANEVFELSAELAQAEASMATQRQVQNDLNSRLAALTETLRALRERDARIAEQSEALVQQLQDERLAATASSTTAQPSTPVSATTNEAIPTTPTAQATAAAAVVATTTPGVTPSTAPARAAPSAPLPAAQEAGIVSFVESLISGPAMWTGIGALVLVVLAATFALIRRRKVASVAIQPRAGGANEDATREKLAEVRERFTASDRFIAKPLQQPDKDGASGAVHLTDAAHASRFAKEAAVHLAYGDLSTARHGIEEAIRLDPHRDEHKMVLVTVLEGMGEQAKAREIIDEMLTRREELSGELRNQVEQLKRISAG